MQQHNVEPNTPEWMDLRAKHRTASEASIVCGVSPFTTPENFKLIKAGLKKQFYSKKMQLGHKLEDQVRQWANKHLNLDLKEQVWSEGQYLASLDGIDGTTNVEIKVSDITYCELKEGIVAEYYNLQMQQQMYCSPATHSYLVAYSPKKDAYAISHRITEDYLAMEQIENGWTVFDNMAIPDTPIDMTDDGKVHNLFKLYHDFKRNQDNIKKEMDEIKKQLITLAHEKSIFSGDYKLTKKKGSTRTDYKAATKGMDLHEFQTTGEPTFSITVPKSPFDE